MNDTILVIGGAGYIGSQLCRDLLVEGYKVRVLDNLIRNHGDALLELIPDPNFEFIYGDATSRTDVKKAMDGVDFVYCLCGIVGEPVCRRHKEIAYLYNAEAVGIIAANLPKDAGILYSGTGSSYGFIPNGLCTEETPTNPISDYAISKLQGESLIQDLTSNYVILRLSTLMGLSPNGRMDLLVNDLCYQSVKNKSLVIFQADFKRSFIHVKDISRAMVFGMQNLEKMRGGTYNIANESGNITKRDLAELLKEKTGCAVFYGDEEYKDVDGRSYFVSSKKINDLGWQAQIGVEETIDELIKAMPLIQIRNHYDCKI